MLNVQAEQVRIVGPLTEAYKTILTEDAVRFLARLSNNFEGRRQELLDMRRKRQEAIDRGTMPDFLPETERTRKAEWTVAPIPTDLQDRRVEITGPVERRPMAGAAGTALPRR
jgi:malate synthase